MTEGISLIENFSAQEFPAALCAVDDPEMEMMARRYDAYIMIRSLFEAEGYNALDSHMLHTYLTFEQYIMLFTPRATKDWAYIDNRTSNFQRRRNGTRTKV